MRIKEKITSLEGEVTHSLDHRLTGELLYYVKFDNGEERYVRAVDVEVLS